MRKVAIAAAAMILLSAQTVMAQMKVGVVYGQEMVQSSEAWKKVQGEMKNKIAPLEAELNKMGEDFKKLEEEYKNKAVALTQEAKAGKENELRTKFQKLNEAQQRLQQTAQSEQKRLGDPLLMLSQQVVGEYGAKNGYTVIFEGSQIMYASDAVNITKDVIREIDAAYKAGRMPAPQAAGSPAGDSGTSSKPKKK